MWFSGIGEMTEQQVKQWRKCQVYEPLKPSKMPERQRLSVSDDFYGTTPVRQYLRPLQLGVRIKDSGNQRGPGRTLPRPRHSEHQRCTRPITSHPSSHTTSKPSPRRESSGLQIIVHFILKKF
jgi:hypothetical protein